jgi:hypothetical protein
MNTDRPYYPNTRTVLANQLRLLWQSGHFWLLVAVCTVPLLLLEVERVQAMMLLPANASARFTASRVPLLDTIRFLILAGLLWPLLVWRGESHGKREYFWSLPVNHASHELLRVAAGGIVLVAAVAACALAGVLLGALHGGTLVFLPDGSHLHYQPGALFWLGFMTSPLIPYVLGSMLPLALRRPLEWLIAIVGSWILLAGAAATFGQDGLFAVLTLPVDHTLGLQTALGGGAWTEYLEFLQSNGAQRLDMSAFERFTVARWALASSAWLALGVLGLLAATRRRR